MTYATLCTGIGGFDVGFDDAGMECAFQCEIDKDCNRVLPRHWPNVSRTTDANDERTAAELVRLRPDLLAFGFPCQDLSVAGRRAGLAGKRSGLFFRCADLIAACRPRWLCIENVPGLLSSNGGRDMGIVLGTLGDLGYGYAYRVLDAQWFGIAQRRRRVFIVGCLGDVRSAAEVLFERESLPWDSPPSREAGARAANAITRRLGSSGPDDNRAQGNHLVAQRGGERVDATTEPARCLTSHGGRFDLDTETFIAHTLRAEGFDTSKDGTGRGTPLVPVAFAQNQRDEVRDLRDCAGALAAEPGVKQQTYVAFQCHGSNVGEMGTLRRGNGSTTGGVPFVASDYANGDFKQSDLSRPITCSPDRSRATPVVKQQSGVRRLTPRECERLQGFSDDWTRWAADGTEVSDSARYRMLGNAVCVNVARWLGRRSVAAR
jgi:DNA (cytosine-5)-methyltransferase 1